MELLARERVERADLEALDLSDDLRVLLKTRMSGQMLKPGYQEDHLYLTVDAAHYLAQAGHQAGRLRLPVDRPLRLRGLSRPTTRCSGPASS